MKKKNKIYKKYFYNNDEYFHFIKTNNVKVLSVTYTHNYKIKVTYVII